MSDPARWIKRLEDFFGDDPHEPEFDPADLASVLIVVMVVMGALYWLLWTLLVYEGGIFSKLAAVFHILAGSRKLSDFGYLGSYEQGLFEGWLGNLGALILTVVIVAALHRLYQEAAKRHET